jgi:predicted dehydrogenase
MKTKPSNRIPITRRSFLTRTALASSAFMVVPSHVLGLGGAPSANERLNIGAIGVGGQGAGVINAMKSENIVALCDVDWRHAAKTFKDFPKAKQYKDYRKMLDEQKDIDAVIVATPDHHHAFASMQAIQLGKHVYCEKPLTHSVWEARQLATAAREKKVATQMGNSGQASEGRRRLAEMIWDGAIGKVTEAHIWTDRPSRGLLDEYWPQGVTRPKDTPEVPDTLAWDLWLGPAPERPYHPAYAPFKWRGWWDFGTGALGDIGCHSFDPVFRALKLGHPTSVEATSSRVNEETFPLASMVTYHFPARDDMPALKLVWYDGGLRPARHKHLTDGKNLGATGHMIVGDRGVLLAGAGRGGWTLHPDKLAREYGEAPKTIPRSPGHHVEWIQACKGGAPAGSNFDFAGPLTEVVLLGNVALRRQMREELTGKSLLWDPKNLKFTNSERANDFLRREYRKGWKLV